MADTVRFRAPFGLLGVLGSRVVLEPYLARLLAERGQEIQRAAKAA